MAILSFDSPLGPIAVTATDGAITSLEWASRQNEQHAPVLEAARDDISSYP